MSRCEAIGVIPITHVWVHHGTLQGVFPSVFICSSVKFDSRKGFMVRVFKSSWTLLLRAMRWKKGHTT